MPDWVQPDVAAKRKLLKAPGVQHRCVRVTADSGFALESDRWWLRGGVRN